MKIIRKITQVLLVSISLMIPRALFAVGKEPVDSSGIRFEQAVKWSGILAKAKAEHKYIFVDCYATWCGPCKLMAQKVFPQREVGEIYNSAFISVKVQMDKTAADNDQVKSWYKAAGMLETNYHVDEYPTYLFFDPEGRPVHKVIGSMSEKDFIQLAKDAQNPDKQYYAILKNFQPGKLDTADEKGLAYAFANSDKELAGKIAADYLNRVPKDRFDQFDKGKLMVSFQNNPQVLEHALAIIRFYSKAEFIQNGHARFIIALDEHKQVQELVLKYFKSLTYQEMAEPVNIRFMENFADNPEIQRLAEPFIKQLPDKDRYIKEMLAFIGLFMHHSSDVAFGFYYNNTARIDSVMSDAHYAQNVVIFCIANDEWQPVLETAKQSGGFPDFMQLDRSITKKYNSWYGKQVRLNATLEWYKYLVHEKKQDGAWPQLVMAELNKDKQYLTDPTMISYFDVNNGCWDAYLHSDDSATLDLAASLMAQVTKNIILNNGNEWDTYAAVLYKSGRVNEAVSAEEQVLNKFDTTKHPVIAASYRKKIEAMKKGEKIWLEPAFQH